MTGRHVPEPATRPTSPMPPGPPCGRCYRATPAFPAVASNLNGFVSTSMRSFTCSAPAAPGGTCPTTSRSTGRQHINGSCAGPGAACGTRPWSPCERRRGWGSAARPQQPAPSWIHHRSRPAPSRGAVASTARRRSTGSSGTSPPQAGGPPHRHHRAPARGRGHGRKRARPRCPAEAARRREGALPGHRQGLGRQGLHRAGHPRTRRQDRIDIEIVTGPKPPPGTGFLVQPRRWVVERTHAPPLATLAGGAPRINRNRRMARRWEATLEAHTGFLILSQIAVLLNRLT